VPMGKLKSSQITRSELKSTSSLSTTSLTAKPLLFMCVVGLTRTIWSPAYFFSAMRYSPVPSRNRTSRRVAISSATINPTLCLVFSYTRSGFPRPTMQYTVFSDLIYSFDPSSSSSFFPLPITSGSFTSSSAGTSAASGAASFIIAGGTIAAIVASSLRSIRYSPFGKLPA